MVDNNYIKNELMKLLNRYKFNLISFYEFYDYVEKFFNEYVRPSKTKDKILISQFNGIGDAICSSGFIREVSKKYDDVVFVGSPYSHNIMELCPYAKTLYLDPNINNMFTILEDEINFLADNDLFNTTIAFSPIWDPHISILFLNWLSSAYKRVGYGEYVKGIYILDQKYYDNIFHNKFNFDDYVLTDNIINPIDMISDIDRRYYLLEKSNIKVENKDLEVWFNNEDLAKTNYTDSIIVGLGGSTQSKKYPVTKWIQVLKKINKPIILIGGKNEESDAQKISESIDCINLVNQLTLRETAALISKNLLYVGHDSAAVHMAAACKKPVVVLSAHAEDKQQMNGFLSWIDRFKPYNTQSIILRPKYAIDDCKETYILNGCCHHDESHCIKHIPTKRIINAINTFL